MCVPKFSFAEHTNLIFPLLPVAFDYWDIQAAFFFFLFSFFFCCCSWGNGKNREHGNILFVIAVTLVRMFFCWRRQKDFNACSSVLYTRVPLVCSRNACYVSSDAQNKFLVWIFIAILYLASFFVFIIRIKSITIYGVVDVQTSTHQTEFWSITSNNHTINCLHLYRNWKSAWKSVSNKREWEKTDDTSGRHWSRCKLVGKSLRSRQRISRCNLCISLFIATLQSLTFSTIWIAV